MIPTPLEVIIVSGGRKWLNPRSVRSLIDRHPLALWIVGDCPSGLDEMARSMLVAAGAPHVRFLAEWDRYGRAAGPIRNHEMVDSALLIAEILGVPVTCYGFHEDILTSRGTRECLTYAKKHAIPCMNIKR